MLNEEDERSIDWAPTQIKALKRDVATLIHNLYGQTVDQFREDELAVIPMNSDLNELDQKVTDLKRDMRQAARIVDAQARRITEHMAQPGVRRLGDLITRVDNLTQKVDWTQEAMASAQKHTERNVDIKVSAAESLARNVDERMNLMIEETAQKMSRPLYDIFEELAQRVTKLEVPAEIYAKGHTARRVDSLAARVEVVEERLSGRTPYVELAERVKVLERGVATLSDATNSDRDRINSLMYRQAAAPVMATREDEEAERPYRQAGAPWAEADTGPPTPLEAWTMRYEAVCAAAEAVGEHMQGAFSTATIEEVKRAILRSAGTAPSE